MMRLIKEHIITRFCKFVFGIHGGHKFAPKSNAIFSHGRLLPLAIEDENVVWFVDR